MFLPQGVKSLSKYQRKKTGSEGCIQISGKKFRRLPPPRALPSGFNCLCLGTDPRHLSLKYKGSPALPGLSFPHPVNSCPVPNISSSHCLPPKSQALSSSRPALSDLVTAYHHMYPKHPTPLLQPPNLHPTTPHLSPKAPLQNAVFEFFCFSGSLPLGFSWLSVWPTFSSKALLSNLQLLVCRRLQHQKTENNPVCLKTISPFRTSPNFNPVFPWPSCPLNLCLHICISTRPQKDISITPLRTFRQSWILHMSKTEFLERRPNTFPIMQQSKQVSQV